MRIRKTQNSKVCSNYFGPLFKQMVIDIRAELAKEYDVTGEEYYKYTGLCDEASSRIKDRIMEYAKKYHVNLSVDLVHGEIAHDGYCPSKYWQYQHTWVEAAFPNGLKLYIDPTMGQFQKFLPKIPDWYVSYVKPVWYYADKDNPRWNGWLKHRVVKHKRLDDMYDRIMYFFQYTVWGTICDHLL